MMQDDHYLDLEARRVHWPLVAQMRCVVSGMTPITLHHCTGGSMVEIGVARGVSQKVSDWLVIPLHPRYHVGDFGIDSGDIYWGVTDHWEEAFGTQRELLDKVSLHVGYNVFRRAGYDYDSYWTRHLP